MTAKIESDYISLLRAKRVTDKETTNLHGDRKQIQTAITTRTDFCEANELLKKLKKLKN